ncbi:hypothetical protein [Neorickettsia findlayensis]|uniref:Uncharacterized protein n=1 Tax=Neorickettsia findlayensis TaxID=2686014 RepID=A0A6P1G8X2_9RICK|nr:hypothetical protein [Neorickettsia findlayensis]QHD64919.1 hypothetical protein GP480_00305 [Neorickettsia findlayensis]
MKPKRKQDQVLSAAENRIGALILFVLALVILAVQMAKRIPWRSNSEVTKSWWCLVYLQLVIAGFIMVLISWMGLILTMSAFSAEPDAHKDKAVSDDQNRKRKASNMVCYVLAFVMLLVLPVALSVVTAFLDHRGSLSLTEKRVLAGVETVLLALILLSPVMLCFCYSMSLVRCPPAEPEPSCDDGMRMLAHTATVLDATSYPCCTEYVSLPDEIAAALGVELAASPPAALTEIGATLGNGTERAIDNRRS